MRSLIIALALATWSSTPGSWTGTGAGTGHYNTGNGTTCTLNAASPSTCNVTVTPNAICSCAPVGATAAIAAGGCALGSSSTGTMAVTGPNASSVVINVTCDR